MTRLTRLALLLPIAAAALLALPRQAAAQCDGTELFCASASFSVGANVQVAPAPPRSAQVIITPRPPPPAARVIITTRPAPPPPVVVVRQVPPPPPRQVVVIRATPQPQQAVIVQPLLISTEQRIGIHGHIGAMVGPDVQMGGFTGALRLRPVPHFALDFGIGAYAGQDYNGLDRVEVPVTVDALLYVNPLQRMQFYLLAGIGVSRAHAEGFTGFGSGDYVSREYTHVGGELGLGLEWRLNPHFALSSDVRAFLRTRIDSNPQPEFMNPSTGETSDLSTGALLTLGGTVYF